MKNFAMHLVCIIVVLATALFLIGKINQKKFSEIDGNIAAQYSHGVQWLVVISYGIISALPIAIASSLKEGDPIVDRISFTLIHGFFLVMFLWTINRRVVVGLNTVGVSNIFGTVRIIPCAHLVGAKLVRKNGFISATSFVLGDVRISVDDHMQNCAAVVLQLTSKSKISNEELARR